VRKQERALGYGQSIFIIKEAIASKTNIKGLEFSLPWLLKLLHVSDPCVGRPMVTPLHQLFYLWLRAFGHYLDTALRQVSHPAGHS